MKFYFGRVRVNVTAFPTDSAERTLLDRAMRWHFVDGPVAGTTDVFELIGVCPEMDLVDAGSPVPVYDAMFSRDLDGEAKFDGLRRLS